MTTIPNGMTAARPRTRRFVRHSWPRTMAADPDEAPHQGCRRRIPVHGQSHAPRVREQPQLMSTWQDTTAPCPRCANAVAVRVADSVHISRVPHVREQILARTFHLFTCAACAATFSVAKR